MSLLSFFIDVAMLIISLSFSYYTLIIFAAASFALSSFMLLILPPALLLMLTPLFSPLPLLLWLTYAAFDAFTPCLRHFLRYAAAIFFFFHDAATAISLLR